MQRTSISWVLGPNGAPGFTWNPFAGCAARLASRGCEQCYAARLAATRLAHLTDYSGLASKLEGPPHWTGEVRFFPDKLAEPLRRRKPSGIFVGDMGDIALLPFEQIAAIFGVMAACPQHRFYVLSKRPERLRKWFDLIRQSHSCCDGRAPMDLMRFAGPGPVAAGLFALARQNQFRLRRVEMRWPPPNVWVGTSVCTKADLGNVEHLAAVPAALRYLSVEPLLEDVNLGLMGTLPKTIQPSYMHAAVYLNIHWVIAGGESGPLARPCHLEHLRSIVRQCREADTPVFVKQLGARPVDECTTGLVGVNPVLQLVLRDRAGADMAEWPEDLRCREMPKP